MSRANPAVTVLPVVLFSILDHSLRRHDDQERVIGTLLGERSPDGTQVEIKASFAVPHGESSDGVEVDMEYHKQMLALHLKANPREVLVGWYASTLELNAFSALIQNFYGSAGDGTAPFPAIHLTMAADPAQGMQVKTYVSSSVGVTPERVENSCLFVPISHTVTYGEQGDRSAVDAIAAATHTDSRKAQIPTTLTMLRNALNDTLDMIARVQQYVGNVVKDEAAMRTPENQAIGRFLMDALSVRPSLDPEAIEKMFNSLLQDVLMVSYLARTVREQIEISTQLALVAQ
ncbi:JAB1/Mov34/MPN/PAD-1 ubiquitin protease-domain-containing protein [Protomyces lactucae-debilis]|uniref:Eukaryotic translation initiation factor 3 subunit F n=1 Tax=Protomyces lactucae-debilis TaxID=2754530 RepID=A0A1Y2FGG8_PROLT|nr:JAB1/Mov34/MPN/PAD-1 ubiquitin protease-domain-containing protein [Protomyces lactucae-debilis]ORY83031.1 JAB1/Mov34/MPN/PAD-1 ubiquitin protease-domain-containing protein [Protomyces lactucae-debilis]